MAQKSKADEFKERFWEHTRHLSQGVGPEGSIHQVELDASGEDRTLTVTMNEGEGEVRTYTLEVTAGRKRRAVDA